MYYDDHTDFPASICICRKLSPLQPGGLTGSRAALTQDIRNFGVTAAGHSKISIKKICSLISKAAGLGLGLGDGHLAGGKGAGRRECREGRNRQRAAASVATMLLEATVIW